MKSIIRHQCSYMMNNKNFFELDSVRHDTVYERNELGIWQLLDHKNLIEEGCHACKWCGIRLLNLEVCTKSSVSLSHRCSELPLP
jgi:hypothetical protein